MTLFDMIKAHMSKSVPFASHVGIEITKLDEDGAEAQLEQTENISNHIQTLHAGALFTLGESASGAALGGALAPVITSIRPVAAKASIDYKKIAEGKITAYAKTSKPASKLQDLLSTEGRITFDVFVDLRNENDISVAEMTVNWHVKNL